VAFDLSRIVFDPRKDYSGVVMEQGRVQLDSDWNEWLAELNRRLQAETLDLLGHAAYPSTTPGAFQITATSGPNAISIGCGRMYLDGLLAENHGEATDGRWDPALAELSGAPQPPADPPPPPSPGNTVGFGHQPFYPGAQLPVGDGPYLFYLDVWLRAVTWLEDSGLIEKAVGVDTTGRIQTAWQVKWMEFPEGETYTCATPDSQIAYPPASAGLLTTGVVPVPASGPCCISDGTGYTGLENQLYRVEIHQAGIAGDPANPSGAGFKWSRDNASVATGVTAISSGANIAGDPASVLTVMSLGRDEVLGFGAGDWIEVLDDWSELAGDAGPLCQIDSVDVASRMITLTTTLPATPSFPVDADGLTDPQRHTRIVRWDQSGTVYKLNGSNLETWCELADAGGLIPVPEGDTTLLLEDGITVTFTTSSPGGSFNVGDFWTFAARTADGSVEELSAAPPRGIHHHYTKLSVIDFSGSSPSATDCRTAWPPSGADACGCCCTCTVGEGGKFSSIQQAFDSLPATGGEVCILPGRYFERVVLDGLKDVVIHGCGAQTRIASPSLDPSATSDVPAENSVTGSALAAVVTLVGCEHVQLRSVAIEAGDDEAGILLDWRPAASATRRDIPIHLDEDVRFLKLRQSQLGNVDVTIEDTVLTASTLPAVLALSAELLTISGNRIAMADVASRWPAMYVRGTEIRVERNWVGLRGPASALAREPASVEGDLGDGPIDVRAEYGAAAGVAPGGIQIGGPSKDVVVTDNEIEGGSRNGITLGSVSLLDQNGTDTGESTGVLVEVEDECGTAGTLGIPGIPTKGPPGRTVVAGGPLANITINRNRIRGMGLCGVGPVGFFDLRKTPEVISIENLTVTGNEITRTLLRPVSAQGEPLTSLGYGAICVPDIRGLAVRDNTITGFGATAGSAVCGIFILHAEEVEISRNHIDQALTFDPSSGNVPDPGLRGGIIIVAVTPPTVASATATATAVLTEATFVPAPVYDTGLPALCLEHNVVRVPVGLGLGVLGFGAFSIVNNFFSSGELIERAPAATVQVMNLGVSVELARPATKSRALYEYDVAMSAELGRGSFGSASAGAVLFTGNFCEVKASADSPSGTSSVLVVSLDDLLFANNICRVESPKSCLTLDALLAASTVQVESNRFQEAFRSVFLSGFTTGLANITSANLSTYCLIARAATPAGLVRVNNLALVGSALCDKYVKFFGAANLTGSGANQ
jgi:Family of unknown function (DUF6519)